MSSSINSRSSFAEIGNFINSQEDQLPVGKEHMPAITKAVDSFFKSHRDATITHLDTSLLDRVTVEFTEHGRTETAVLEVVKSRSPSPRTTPSPTTSATASIDSPRSEIVPITFSKDLESKISEEYPSLSKGQQNSLLITIVRKLSEHFASESLRGCKITNISTSMGWTIIDFASGRSRITFQFKND
jgi:hypothetical protein